MKLKVLAPAKVVLEAEAREICARSYEGYFCLLEHHVDFVSALAPGVLTLIGEDGGKQSLAIDEGTLVKCGDEVLVATRAALTQKDAGEQTITDRSAGELVAADAAELNCRRVINELQSEITGPLLGEER